MNEGGLVFELVTDSSGLEGLEVDWNSLWQSTANSRYELSHSVVWHSWRTVAKPQGHGLCTVVGRIDGRVVLIWPAILRQEKFQGIWRVVSWLGRDPIDYGAILAEPASDLESRVAGALKFLSANCGADLLSLSSVPADSYLHQHLQQLCPRAMNEESAPRLDLSAWQSWGDYERSLSSSFRKNLRRKYRRLCDAGEVRFEFRDDVATVKEAVDWITEHKKAWLKDRGIERWLLTSQQYATAMVDTLRDAPAGVTLVSRLLVDNRVIAADINLVSGGRFYSDYGSFDLDWSRYSPGALLMQESIRWAFDHDLEQFDLGRGDDDYKLKWSSGAVDIDRFLYPCNWRGLAYVYMRTSRMVGYMARLRAPA